MITIFLLLLLSLECLILRRCSIPRFKTIDADYFSRGRHLANFLRPRDPVLLLALVMQVIADRVEL